MNKVQRWITLAPFWGERAAFYRDLAESLEEKELLREFVDGELQIAKAPKTANSTRASALGYMKNLIESGMTAIHEVLRHSMPESDALGIAVIADARDKSDALRYVAANVDEQMAMNQVVKSAMRSPLLLLPVAFVFSYVMTTTVLPSFEKNAPPEVWTGFAEFVRVAAGLFRNWAPLLSGCLVVALGWFVIFGLPNITSPWRFRAESAVGWNKAAWWLLGPIQPLLSIYRDIESSRMLANLATLLQTGRGLQDAIMQLSQSASPWMRRHLLLVVDSMQSNPGEYVLAFSNGLLSKDVLARLHTKVRRDSGNDFAQVLIEIGTKGQEKAREAVSAYAARLNFFLLISVFGLILFFYGGQNWIVMRIQEEMTPSAIQRRAIERRMEQPSKVDIGLSAKQISSTTFS